MLYCVFSNSKWTWLMVSKVCVITLGCSKNVVDSERLIGHLENSGMQYTENLKKADSVIINTCGFIKPSKEESLDIIAEAIELKRAGRIKRVVVMGCMAERYKEELNKQLEGVDAVFGLNADEEIVNFLTDNLKHELVGERHLLTPKHFAYLKISEGCNHGCTFCAIPLIRGKYSSRSIEDLVREVEYLADLGVKELNVIAQDTTYYGKDLFGSSQTAKLLNQISEVKGIDWIRMLYTYPVGFPEDLLDEMASNHKICKYIDIPFQHISDKMLKNMGRGTTKKQIYSLIEKIRNKVPNVAIRSTFIVGFPQETEKDFIELYDFIKEIKLDRVGVFPYSHEESTKAYELKDNVPDGVKKERRGVIMELQQGISLAKNKSKIGSIQKVILDSSDGEYYYARTEHDAPEVDNSVIIKSNRKHKLGNFGNVLITEAQEYDIFGELV